MNSTKGISRVVVTGDKCGSTDKIAKILVSLLFQMKPTRCTPLLSIFISTSVHVSGNYVRIIRRTYCIYATLVFFTLYGWLSGLQTRQLGSFKKDFTGMHGQQNI
jgi:hypothetical protein